MQTHFRKAKVALSISLAAIVLSVLIAITDPFNLGEPWAIGLVLAPVGIFSAFGALACAVEIKEDFLQYTAVILIST